MEFRHLRYFITVVEQSTFTTAASILHISQPSLSTSIKNLEKELGLILIDRSTRESRITKEGKVLYLEAKKLINHYEHVVGEMKRLKQQGPSELSIGLIESSKFWVPKILANFKQEYKDVRIRLLEVLGLQEVERALNNFDTHLAITNQYIDNKEIETIPIYDEKLVALLPPMHPLKNKSYININDLEGEAFIVCKEGFQTREDILNAFRKSGIKPNVQFELERFETACSLVEDGLGITVVPENYVKYSKKSAFHIKQIHDSNISRTVYLAYDKNRYLPPLVLSFIALVKDFFDDKPDH
ncbi:LysR family transcriptional regulator [Pseudalkalibacillus decolorationis]|uniref:LysR family transcriptional regulator n=1 Tax=Pseudalkalibacillus decolorationis TaxID=163879 RepID=UPI002147E912|nr:LysR family transcriptional regulator [Pseudalkalibacillus decolorationis]